MTSVTRKGAAPVRGGFPANCRLGDSRQAKFVAGNNRRLASKHSCQGRGKGRRRALLPRGRERSLARRTRRVRVRPSTISSSARSSASIQRHVYTPIGMITSYDYDTLRVCLVSPIKSSSSPTDREGDSRAANSRTSRDRVEARPQKRNPREQLAAAAARGGAF